MKKLTKGFTLIEMLIVIGILGVLAVALLLTINPSEAQKKTRDTKRMKDLTTIQTIVDQAINDGVTLGTCLNTAAGCSSAAAGLAPQPCGANWLSMDACQYVQTVPVDPANGQTRTVVSGPGTFNTTMNYRAIATGSNYEIGVRLEAGGNRNAVTADGGDDNDWAEAGNSPGLSMY